jgi:hypothetical protein
MAATFLSPPGTEYGPCADPCVHIDCAASRDQAATPCTICRQPIGYDTYYWTVNGLPEHRTCTVRSQR